MTTNERTVEPPPQKRIRKTKTYPVAVFDVEQRTEMNAVLVSIFSNVVTQNHVFSWEVSEEVRDYLEDSKEEYDLIISIQLLFAHLLYGEGSYAKPTEFVKKVLSKDLEIEDTIPVFHPKTKFGIFLHQFINRMNQSEKKHWMFSPKSEGENISFWSSTFFGNIDALIEEEEENKNENKKENENEKEKEKEKEQQQEIKNENQNEQKDENKIQASSDSQFQSLNVQQIPIYVEHQNLYTSIDKFLNQIVGENQSVVLFTKLPKILLFEIQENEKLSNYKLFKYEKVIYMDRFLMKNSQQVKQKKTQEKNHHKTIKKVEREIQKLENWKSSNISVLDGLKHTLNYLKLQKQQSSQNSERSNNLKKMISVLNQQIENFLKQLKQLSFQQERLRNQINLLYKEMNQSKYLLDSIIFKKIVQNKEIYFNITRRKDGKWYKFENSKVSPIKEEQILNYHHGFDNVILAGLIYTCGEFINNNNKLEFDKEAFLLKENLKQDVEKKNKELQELYQKWKQEEVKHEEQKKYNNFFTKIDQEYSKEQDRIEELSQKKSHLEIALENKNNFIFLTQNQGICRFIIAKNIYLKQTNNQIDLFDEIQKDRFAIRILKELVFDKNLNIKLLLKFVDIEWVKFQQSMKLFTLALENLYNKNYHSCLIQLINLYETLKIKKSVNKRQLYNTFFNEVLIQIKSCVYLIFNSAMEQYLKKKVDKYSKEELELLLENLNQAIFAARIAMKYFFVQPIDSILNFLKETPTRNSFVDEFLENWKKIKKNEKPFSQPINQSVRTIITILSSPMENKNIIYPKHSNPDITKTENLSKDFGQIFGTIIKQNDDFRKKF
ncbi:hypothetical protein M0813_02805 [Anaeramoeba flamelloides]|uniref:Uncharacterized protein n=1 Tax=Anaeramoeba flamelloides TaxID=1746091 RepID=A0ABQ8YEC8_9EUKA|nr:hypothetical protein M0813_02805 [Anaeramoeba flamelloides]